MVSVYDNFWLGMMDKIHNGILRAINKNETVTIDVSEIKLLGKRKKWYGILYLDSSGYKKADMAHAQSLGKLLVKQDFFDKIFEQNNIRIRLKITETLDLEIKRVNNNTYSEYTFNKSNLLYEGDVVDSVISYLKNEGYEILSHCYPHQKGYDIVAKKDGKLLYVEAKGSTSSNPKSSRYKIGFNSTQMKVHVAEAIYKSMRTINEKPDCDVGIALPSSDTHKKLVAHVLPSLKKLGIKIFWVDDIGRVTVE
jgi:Holliday junction resolvase-like predicted endonuclease